MAEFLSFAQADELISKAVTKEDIRAVIGRIDVGAGNLVTVLFSGAHEILLDGKTRYLGSIDLADALARSSEGLRVMSETHMGQYMITDSSSPFANQIGRAHV